MLLLLLASALEKHSSLRMIDLNGNGIGDEGCKSLASALAKHSGLQKIYLYGNDIGEEGCKSLAFALPEGGMTL